MGDISAQEPGVIIDLLLSYRAVECWPEMIALVRKMPAHLASTVMPQEQLALALNRDGQAKQAVEVLDKLVRQRGLTTETSGILGRVYKDMAEKYRAVDPQQSSVFLRTASMSSAFSSWPEWKYRTSSAGKADGVSLDDLDPPRALPGLGLNPLFPLALPSPQGENSPIMIAL